MSYKVYLACAALSAYGSRRGDSAKTHSGLEPGAPSAEQVLDFLGALACGAASDRGCARKGRAKYKVRSLRFCPSS